MTQVRLDEVREALGLETSEEAFLLDEMAQSASWVVRQAMADRTIQAVQGGEQTPQVLEHAALSSLKNSVHIELSSQEAMGLVELLSSAPPPGAPLSKTLAALERISGPFELHMSSSK